MICFSLLAQPVCFIITLNILNKTKDLVLLLIFGIIGVTTLMLNMAPRLPGPLAVYILDKAINFEWRTEAKCGDKVIQNDHERYFGVNTNEYTVYFSHRNGQWGFEDLKCIKNEKDEDTFQRLPISSHKMPVLFKP